ncbi:MAG: AAA family ATPase, partial [Acidimicrobiales bacterium]
MYPSGNENEVLALHRKPPLARLGRKLTLAGAVARNGHERRRSTAWAHPRLYEREFFLDELAAMFSGNWERPNCAVIIEGEPWTGKTALLGAARRLAAESGMTVLNARGNDLERGTAWGLVGQLFTRQLPWPPAKANGGAEARAAALVAEPVGDGPSEPGQLATQFRRFEESLWRLSSARPVLVAVDDAHLADPESCRWLFYLARRLGNHRVHLVLTSRAPRRGALTVIDRLRTEPSVRVMAIQPLSKSTVADIVGSALDHQGPWAGELVDAVYEASGGTPFLLLAVLRELSASGLAGGRLACEVGPLAPVHVGKALLARLAGLPADVPSLLGLLQAVAVMGSEADLRGCANLAGLDPARAATLVDCLVDDGLLSSGQPLRCRQGAVAAAAMQEMGSAGRARLHLAAARLLEQREKPAEVVAEHLLLAEHCAEQWAPRRLEAAGRQALSRGDHRKALIFLENALREYPRTSSASLHLDLARATAATDLTAADRAAGALVTTLRKTSARLPRAERDLRVRLEVAAAELAGSSAGSAQAREVIGSLLGAWHPSTTSAERLGLAFLAVVDSTRAATRSAAEVSELLNGALPLAELVSGDPWEARLRAKALLALARAGAFVQAESLASAALGQLGEGSDPTVFAEYSVARAGAVLLDGRLAEAAAEASSSLSAMEGRPWVTRPLALGFLAEALAGQARTTEALDMLGAAAGDPLMSGTSPVDRYLSEQRGHILLLLGRVGDARREFEADKLRAEHDGIDNPAVTSWRSGMAACLKAEGRTVEALLLAEENLALAHAFGAPWLIGRALIEVASVAPRGDRLSLLRDAVAPCEASGATLLVAAALIELGTELASHSDRR